MHKFFTKKLLIIPAIVMLVFPALSFGATSGSYTYDEMDMNYMQTARDLEYASSSPYIISCGSATEIYRVGINAFETAPDTNFLRGESFYPTNLGGGFIFFHAR